MIFIIIVNFDSPVRRGRIIHSRNCTAITTVKDIVIIVIFIIENKGVSIICHYQNFNNCVKTQSNGGSCSAVVSVLTGWSIRLNYVSGTCTNCHRSNGLVYIIREYWLVCVNCQYSNNLLAAPIPIVMPQ